MLLRLALYHIVSVSYLVLCKLNYYVHVRLVSFWVQLEAFLKRQNLYYTLVCVYG